VKIYNTYFVAQVPFTLCDLIHRCGKSLTQFGVSLSQFADLYTGSVNNLLEYEVDHKFVGKNTFLQHE